MDERAKRVDPASRVRFSTRAAVHDALDDPGKVVDRIVTSEMVEHEQHWRARAAIAALWKKGWRPPNADEMPTYPTES